jgi:basic amino acid/polyamine antiporter, APA family
MTFLGQQKEKDVFVRDASGLVRELSTRRATFFNIGGTLGNVAITIAYVALAPTVLILGLPLYIWAILIGAIFAVGYIVCLTVLTHTMPRSGGDYVYTSRITHPLLGFLEGFTFLFALGAGMGYNAWATVFNLGNLLTAGVVYGSGYVSLGSVFTQHSVLLVGTVLVFLLAGLITVLRPGLYYRTVTLLVGIGVVSLFLLFFSLIGVTSAGFAANFQHYSGITTANLMQTANSSGFNLQAPITLTAIASMLSFSIWVYVGYANSTFMAGELRGKPGRNVAISTSIPLFFALFSLGFANIIFLRVIGYNIVNAWAYLFWNNPGAAPFGTAPSTVLLAVIANPGLAPLSLVAGFSLLIIFNFLILVTWIECATRILFAQSMDRTMPKFFSSVSQRTNQPVYSIVFVGIFGFLFAILTIYGYSPISSTYYSVLIGFLALLFPAVNAILFKWRKPSIFKTAPSWATREFLRIPLVGWAGIFWLVFLIPVWGYVTLWGTISSLISSPSHSYLSLLSATFSSGILITVLLIIAGALWFYGYKTYNKRKGYDMDLVFQEIPPE